MLLICFRDALNVQIFIKMHRAEFAERKLKEMQKIDEDHTLTQLATAWQNLAVVMNFVFLYSSLTEKLYSPCI